MIDTEVAKPNDMNKALVDDIVARIDDENKVLVDGIIAGIGDKNKDLVEDLGVRQWDPIGIIMELKKVL